MKDVVNFVFILGLGFFFVFIFQTFSPSYDQLDVSKARGYITVAIMAVIYAVISIIRRKKK